MEEIWEGEPIVSERSKRYLLQWSFGGFYNIYIWYNYRNLNTQEYLIIAGFFKMYDIGIIVKFKGDLIF